MNQPLSVYPQLPGEGEVTLRRGVVAYLDHLALQVEANRLSRERLGNLSRNLSRFVHAWSVQLADGRHVLVPLAEPEETVLSSGRHHRRRRLKWQAADRESALVQARKIAERTPTMSAHFAGEYVVRTNGERPLRECSNDDLTRWLVVNPQWKSDYSKHDALEAIVSCFGWFEDEYKVPNPYRRKRLPKFAKKPRREATIAEYISLMGHRSSKQLRRALWCLYNVQGLRPGSMRGLAWPEFDWDGGFIKTYKHKTAKATGKPLLIALTRRQARFFANLYRQRPPWPDNVFLNTDGQPWTRRAFALHLRRTAVRIGLDAGVAERVTAYCFRHTFATQADEAGAARSDTAMLMGHANERMIRDVYSHASSKVRHVKSAADRMETLRRQARRIQAREAKRRQGEDGGLF